MTWGAEDCLNLPVRTAKNWEGRLLLPEGPKLTEINAPSQINRCDRTWPAGLPIWGLGLDPPRGSCRQDPEPGWAGEGCRVGTGADPVP